jgi:hypothetical protein
MHQAEPMLESQKRQAQPLRASDVSLMVQLMVP